MTTLLIAIATIVLVFVLPGIMKKNLATRQRLQPPIGTTPPPATGATPTPPTPTTASSSYWGARLKQVLIGIIILSGTICLLWVIAWSTGLTDGQTWASLHHQLKGEVVEMVSLKPGDTKVVPMKVGYDLKWELLAPMDAVVSVQVFQTGRTGDRIEGRNGSLSATGSTDFPLPSMGRWSAVEFIPSKGPANIRLTFTKRSWFWRQPEPRPRVSQVAGSHC